MKNFVFVCGLILAMIFMVWMFKVYDSKKEELSVVFTVDSSDRVFSVGDTAKFTVEVSGGQAPYTVRVLYPDASFVSVSVQSEGAIQFSHFLDADTGGEWLSVRCRVTDSTGNKQDGDLPIKINVK
jgi:hypothetical protein